MTSRLQHTSVPRRAKKQENNFFCHSIPLPPLPYPNFFLLNSEFSHWCHIQRSALIGDFNALTVKRKKIVIKDCVYSNPHSRTHSIDWVFSITQSISIHHKRSKQKKGEERKKNKAVTMPKQKKWREEKKKEKIRIKVSNLTCHGWIKEGYRVEVEEEPSQKNLRKARRRGGKGVWKRIGVGMKQDRPRVFKPMAPPGGHLVESNFSNIGPTPVP